jgi:hypothetical protein
MTDEHPTTPSIEASPALASEPGNSVNADPFAPLFAFEPGWDGCDAEPPNAESVEAARAFVAEVAPILGQPAKVTPSVPGGVTLTWKGVDRTRRANFRFDNDNTKIAYLLLYDGSGRLDWFERIDGGEFEVKRAVEKAARFLGLEATPDGR